VAKLKAEVRSRITDTVEFDQICNIRILLGYIL